MKSTSRIDKIGIHHVNGAVLRCPLLEPFLNDNDKTPLWDGSIFVYFDTDGSKKHINGKVPVQVKTRSYKYAFKDEINYNIGVSELKKYNRDGGIVYIVVYLSPDEKSYRIYYKILLPYDIVKLVKWKRDSDSVAIHFRSLPNNECDIAHIFQSFLQEQPRQHYIADSGFHTLEELVKSGLTIRSISFSIPNYGYEGSDPHLLLSRSDVYINAEVNGGLKLPIDKIEHPQISMKMEASIKVKDREFYSSYSIEYNEGVRTLQIGNSTKLSSPEILPGTISFNSKGNLAQRIHDIDFIVSAVTAKSFSIDDCEMIFSNIDEKQIHEYRKILDYLKMIHRMLEALDVRAELEMDVVSEVDNKNMYNFINAVIYGAHLSFPIDKNKPCIVTYELANLKIIIWAEPDNEGFFSIQPMSKASPIKIIDNGSERLVSPYILLDKEHYIMDSNLNYDNIYSTLTSFDSSKEYNGHVNRTALEMLLAYDKNKNQSLLLLADNLFSWLCDQENGSDAIYSLNKLQSKKRQRDLTQEEYLELERIKNLDDLVLSFGSCILLGNEAEAMDVFPHIPMERRDELIKTPIINFLSSENREKIISSQNEEGSKND